MGDAGGLVTSPDVLSVVGTTPRQPAPAQPPVSAHEPQPAPLPVSVPAGEENWLQIALAHRGISRRRFLGFAASMTALLALPAAMTPQIVKALETSKKPTVLWLEFQDCAGNTESMLRSASPTIADIVLDAISLEYHETIMAGAGAAAEAVLQKHIAAGDIDILIVEGSIPTKDGGVYCTIAGKTAVQHLQEAAAASKLVIAVGACAWDGGFPALGPTGARGVSEFIGNKPLVNLGGCPHNVANTTATIVHYLTFGSAPELDQYNRPMFAYGHLIHDQCERRANFDAGRFVEAWGDEGHRNGWCLYKMGCKGPQATYNCPIVRWNGGTSWPIGAGHGCIACASPHFWANMSPFYDRLPDVKMFGVDAQAQTIGLAAIGVVSVATAAHAGSVIVRRSRDRRKAVVAPDGTVGPESPSTPTAPSDGSGTSA